MISYVTGDLLQDDAQALVNTVNTVGVMGKGIALQFKEAFPENYNIYRRACKNDEFHVGEMLITEAQRLSGNKLIVNFPTKKDWRKPSDYSYISDGLKTLRREIVNRNISSIAIPPLGSSNGGLDWNVVKKMIIDELSDLENCDVRIYEPSQQIIERMKSERVKLTPARAMLLDVMHDMTRYGEIGSVFAAEKIVYFLQRFGAEKIFNIKFQKYHYGPYSGGKIEHVLYYLNGSYVMGMNSMQVKPFENIWLVSDTYNDIKSYLNQNEDLQGILIKTKDFFRGFYSNLTLEMLATVDFILGENYQAMDWKTVDREELKNKIKADLQGWSQRKEKLFANEKHLDLVLDHLKEYNL